MIEKVIAVYDKKLGLFHQPTNFVHIGEALRQWDHVRADKGTKIGMNPEDFDLYVIGEFEPASGYYSNLQPHQHLATGV